LKGLSWSQKERIVMNLNEIRIEGIVKALKSWDDDDSKASMVRFRLGNRRKGRDENLDWFTVKIFGEAADEAIKHLKEGDVVRITGQLWQDEWKDKSGEKHEETMIKSTTCEVLSQSGTKHKGFIPAQDKKVESTVGAGADIPF
jgi:single-stranded DNA-binding protein